MKKKCTGGYLEIFQKLKELCPEFALSVFISDFEKALKRAVKTAFPNAKIMGCYFHYSQAILRKVNNLGLKRLYRKNKIVQRVVRMLIQLALLPYNKIQQGFDQIVQYVDREGGGQRQILQPLLA